MVFQCVINIAPHCEHVIYTVELLSLACLEVKQLFLSYRCFVYHRGISGLHQSVQDMGLAHGAMLHSFEEFSPEIVNSRMLFCIFE